MAAYPVQTFDQEWSTGCCSWCGGKETQDGCKTCICSACCPCVQYGWNSEKLPRESGAPFASDCFLAGFIWALLAYVGCACFLHMGTRAAIRRKYNLKADPCHDCCFTWCCGACALCQEHYQLTGPHNSSAVAKPVAHAQ